MRKGFIFTLFAFFIISMLMVILAAPKEFGQTEDNTGKISTDEAFYFMRSAELDLPRTTDISGRRALVALVTSSMAQTNVTPSQNTIQDLLFNGSINQVPNPLMENSTLLEWNSKIRQLSEEKYIFNLTFRNESSTNYPFEVEFNYMYNVSLQDLPLNLQFSPQGSIRRNISIEAIEDPYTFLNTKGLFSSKYSECNSSNHATLQTTGTQTNIDTWASGKSLSISTSPVPEPPSNTIALVSDLCSFNQTDLNTLDNYEALVSQTTTNLSNPCEGALILPDFVGGADISQIPNNTYLVLNQEDVWENQIYTHVKTGCYFEDPDGPSFLDRTENRSTQNIGSGIAHFLNLSSMPQEIRFERSALDYVYFNHSDYGATQRIKGVTDKFSWFLLDQSHITDWGISDLIY